MKKRQSCRSSGSFAKWIDRRWAVVYGIGLCVIIGATVLFWHGRPDAVSSELPALTDGPEFPREPPADAARGTRPVASEAPAADGAHPPDGPSSRANKPERYKNLDSILSNLVEEFERKATIGDRSAPKVPRSPETARILIPDAPLSEGELVAVTFHLADARHVQKMASFLRDKGGDPRNLGEDYIEAYMPVLLIEEASKQPGVIRARAIVPPISNLGPITSEGAAVHRSASWNATGFTGRNVKVGVIDGGFYRFGELMGTELPTQVQVRCYTSIGRHTSNLADCETSGQVHGAAVAEALTDIAPDVQLYITQPLTEADVQDAVNWMISQGVQVINQSLTWIWDGPGDGTSPNSASLLNTVDHAVDNGIFWANSAGNSAAEHWLGPFNDSDGDGWHNWTGTESCNGVTVRGNNAPIQVQLRWDDVWTQANRDLDLHMILEDGSEEVVSDNTQNGQAGQQPYETISARASEAERVCLQVKQKSGTAPSWLQLNVFLGALSDLQYPSLGSIGNPAESANQGMLAVGATAHYNTQEIEGFSSRGPTPDGRIKPDVVGADRGSSKVYRSFPGTSQSSPHVAGLGALVRGVYPNFTPSQVANWLKANAQDRGTPGLDNIWGHGFVELPAPPTSADLSSLRLSQGRLSPAFSRHVTAYLADVASGVARLTVAATAAQDGANIQILPADADSVTPDHQIDLVSGTNDIFLTVTGTDGAQRTYRVRLVQGSTNVDLSALSLSRGELKPTFSSGVTAYRTRVGDRLTATQVTVQATPKDTAASIRITPADSNADAAGHQVGLNAGDNLISIEVTAPGGGATKTYRITVTRAATPANQAPTAHAGPDQMTTEEFRVTLDGSASSDPENRPLSLAWQQRSGPKVALSDAKAQNPSFRAPNQLADYQLTFALTVNDGAQNSVAEDSVTIQVSADNDPPQANAGQDRTEAAGATVELLGDGSMDPEDRPLTYDWTLESQSAGLPVTLNNAAAPNPTFTAPATNGTLVFSLRVNDGFQNSAAADTVIITVDGAVADHDDDNDGLIDVSSPAQLHAIRWDLDGDGTPESNADDYAAAFAGRTSSMGCRGGACLGYELAANLDMNLAPYNSGEGWTPIGSSSLQSTFKPFTAIFKGNNYSIANLFIRRPQTQPGSLLFTPNEQPVGLFAGLGREGRIESVGLINVNVTGGPNGNDVGSLVGLNQGTIIASYVTGAVTGTGQPNTNNTGRRVGGLVGQNRQGIIAASHADCAVAGRYDVGGLAGENTLGRIVASYATGTAMGRFSTGGLVGRNTGGIIAASYATGTVTGHEAIGGLVAISLDVLAVGSGVETLFPATAINSYWDIQTTGQPSSQGGIGKTTRELQAPRGYRGIYADWNLNVDGSPGADQPWLFGTRSQYPVLQQGGLNSTSQFAAQRPVTDADLQWLATANGTLSPVFRRADTAYVASLAEGVPRLEIAARAKRQGAKVSIVPGDADESAEGHQVGLASDIATVAIGVTAVDGSLTKSYLVRVVRGNQDRDGDGLIEVSNVAQLNAIRWDTYASGRPRENEIDYAAAFSSPISGARCPTVCFGYELIADLDLDVAPFNTGEGWDPIAKIIRGDPLMPSQGPVDNPIYSGRFQGNGHSISNLLINRPDDLAEVGLFGITSREARIEGVKLKNVDITGKDSVGGLVGDSLGALVDSEVTGTVRGQAKVGGLVGNNIGGTILASQMTGNVQGQTEVGGLAGRNRGAISASQAIGQVTGQSEVGGLVGANFATLSASYAAGAVRGLSQVGGLAGSHFGGTLSASYAVSDVKGESEVGGLTGLITAATIRASYAAGAVAGETQVGGLTGRVSDILINSRSADFIDSYWDTEATGQPESPGGLGKTTRELQAPSSYTGIYANWNLDLDGVPGGDDPWHFGTRRHYPVLKHRRTNDALNDQINAQGPGEPAPPTLNQAPEVARKLADLELRSGEEAEADLSGAIRDPEGSLLSYQVQSADPAIAMATLQGSAIHILAQSPGTTEVRVTATDREGLSASQTFAVTVGEVVAFASDASVPEGEMAHLNVELSGPLARMLALNYRLGLDRDPATADADENDHEGRNGILTIPPGETRATISIPIRDDEDIEPTRERFIVTLQAPAAEARVGLGRKTTATVSIEEGVCDRTAGVRDGLRGGRNCTEIRDQDLAARVSLDLSGLDIAALKAKDFLGLSGLRTLRLSDNRLSQWPAEAFKLLPELVSLRLNGNRLSELPAEAFSTQPSLVGLHLSRNQISELPAGLFAGLPALRMLDLSGNALVTLQGAAFTGLSSLRWLHLQGNGLAELPDGLFESLAELRQLHLQGNHLATLPEGIFKGLSNLEEARLEDNPGAPFVLKVEIDRLDAVPEAAGPAELGLRLAQGAPFPIWAKLSATGGVLSASEASLSKGQTSSEKPLTATKGAVGVAVAIKEVSGVPERECGELIPYPCYQGLQIQAGAPLVLFNAEPAVSSKIADQTTLAGESMVFDLSAWFRDAEEDLLRYEATSSDPSLVRVRIEGGRLKLMPLAEGYATVTVRATDEYGRSATLSFVLRVERTMRSQWRGWRTVLLRAGKMHDGT